MFPKEPTGDIQRSVLRIFELQLFAVTKSVGGVEMTDKGGAQVHQASPTMDLRHPLVSAACDLSVPAHGNTLQGPPGCLTP